MTRAVESDLFSPLVQRISMPLVRNFKYSSYINTNLICGHDRTSLGRRSGKRWRTPPNDMARFFFWKKIYKHARLKGERFSGFFFFREKPRKNSDSQDKFLQNKIEMKTSDSSGP